MTETANARSPQEAPSAVPALDHGAIGNGRLIALVSPTSAIEWLCMPRFDSPSVFGSLLDREHGGSWSFQSGGEELRGRLDYLPNTNVLRNVFHQGDLSWEVVDFAPRIQTTHRVLAPVEIVRLVRPLRGDPRLRMVFDPRPDYARAKVSLLESADAIDIANSESAPAGSPSSN
jgi:GH15 family glucan-1,4-alpha-glucosidase